MGPGRVVVIEELACAEGGLTSSQALKPLLELRLEGMHAMLAKQDMCECSTSVLCIALGCGAAFDDVTHPYAHDLPAGVAQHFSM